MRIRKSLTNVRTSSIHCNRQYGENLIRDSPRIILSLSFEVANHQKLITVVPDYFKTHLTVQPDSIISLLNGQRYSFITAYGQSRNHPLQHHCTDTHVPISLQQRHGKRWGPVVDMAIIVHYATPDGTCNNSTDIGDKTNIIITVAETVDINRQLQ